MMKLGLALLGCVVLAGQASAQSYAVKVMIADVHLKMVNAGVEKVVADKIVEFGDYMLSNSVCGEAIAPLSNLSKLTAHYSRLHGVPMDYIVEHAVEIGKILETEYKAPETRIAYCKEVARVLKR